MIIQFCGLSGSGKTMLANRTKAHFGLKKIDVEIIDGDTYREFLCADLGFSKQDRQTNIRRLAFVASRFSSHNILSIISAINPYEIVRKEVKDVYRDVSTVYLKCSLDELIRRDTKGLYARALLPLSDANRLANLSGINDPFEEPELPDLILETDRESVEESLDKLVRFISTRYNLQTS